MISIAPEEAEPDSRRALEDETEVLVPRAPKTAEPYDMTAAERMGKGRRLVTAQAMWLALSVVLFSFALVFVTLYACGKAETGDASTSKVDQSYSKCSFQGVYDVVAGTCLCFNCVEGEKCEARLPFNSTECVVDAAGGNPNMFEEYWVDHPEASTTILASEHIGYGDKLGCDKLALKHGGFRVPEDIALSSRCDLLAEAIRKLHKDIGNADAEEWNIVPGIGSSELIDATLFAFSKQLKSQTTIPVTSQRPYYNGYPAAVGFFAGLSRLQWVQPEDVESEAHPIEYISSPNNPDGALRSQSFPSGRPIYDFAYQWPHFTGVQKSLLDQVAETNGVALFTLSKVTGHAGSRIGWAMTKNASLAQDIYGYVSVSGAIPRESQHRVLGILQHMVATDYRILRNARQEMQRRWGVLAEIFNTSNCFSLQDRGDPVLDQYTMEEALPSPAYAWLHCPSFGPEETCYDYLKSSGINGKAGEVFGADSGEYVRLQLLMRAQTFDVLAEKLRVLVLNESC